MPKRNTSKRKDDGPDRCKYGKKCYQTNKDHRKRFKHDQNNVDEEKRGTSDPGGNNMKNVDESFDLARYSSLIKQNFLVEMPEDFYQFWAFCKGLNPEHPEEALKEKLGLMLGGPYDTITEKLKDKAMGECVCHDRYHYDPPEFQTIIKDDSEKQYHIGYYRDDPKELPACVASNSVSDGCKICPMAENIFGAVCGFISSAMKSCKASQEGKLKKLLDSLTEFAEKKGISLDVKSSKMKKREKLVVAKTFHGAGIVVPVNKDGIGYRQIPETYARQKKIFDGIAASKTADEKKSHFVDLEELVTLVQFANDESDYGMGLELGINVFCNGNETFHSLLQFLLPTAYRLLRRDEFATIIEQFLSKRKPQI